MNNPMTPDYITRLAERVATMAAVPGHIAERDYIAAELLTLAQQGKAGGVADTLSGAQLSAFADACCYTEDEAYATLQLLDEAIAKHPPASPPEAGVTDAVLHKSRQLIVGFMLDCNAIGMIGAAENLGKAIKEYAALAPQPKDATPWLGIAAAMGAFDNIPSRSPKEKGKRTEADIAERIEKQRAKLARRAAKGKHQ